MTTMRRLKPDEVMSDVVRRRLESLVQERAPGQWVAPGPPTSSAAGDAGFPPTQGGAPAVAGRGWRRAVERGADFGRSHLAVVLIVALAGCLWAGYSMVRSRTEPVAAATPTVAEPAPPAASVSASASPRPRIRVHVVGEVKRPGVVTLIDGARVLDAIDAAGGLTAKARLGQLNLAAVLADASQVVVGGESNPGGRVLGADGPAPPAGATAGGASSGGAAASGGVSGRVNLNTATAEQLDTLPGVGPVTAQSILAWRQQHQRFTRVEELQEIDGIGPKTYQRLKDQVVVG